MAFACFSKIESNRSAGIAIALDDSGMVEPGFFNAQAKPARSGKKFD